MEENTLQDGKIMPPPKKIPNEDEVSYPFREIHYKMHLLIFTGKVLIEGGASTDQVQRDLMRAAVYMELPESKVNFQIDYNSFMVSVSDERHVNYTRFMKCKMQGVNMSLISSVNKLIWRAMKRNYPLERYEKELRRVVSFRRHYPWPMEAVGAAVLSGALCKLFGADAAAAVTALFSALVGVLTLRLTKHYSFNPHACTTIAAFVATSVACLFQYTGFSQTPMHAMIAASVFLIPGIPSVNAMDDLLGGYLLSGIARAADTIFSLAALAFGIIMSLWLLGAEDINQIPIRPDEIYLSHTFAAIAAAMGLSITLNLPKGILPIVAVGAVIVVNLRNFLVIQTDANIIAATFAAAAFVGIAGQLVNHWVRAPGSVLTIPAVVPLIPGVLLYRLAYALLNISTISVDYLYASIRGAVEAVTIIGAISVGVTIPMMFFRASIEKAQRQEIERLMVERYLRDDEK